MPRELRLERWWCKNPEYNYNQPRVLEVSTEPFGHPDWRPPRVVAKGPFKTRPSVADQAEMDAWIADACARYGLQPAVTEANAFRLDELKVVAYADRLVPAMLPTIVVPIFQQADQPGQVICPPFKVNGSKVIVDVLATAPQLPEMEDAGRVTRLSTPYHAQAGYELWVDEQMQPHYDPAGRVHEMLMGVAEQAAIQAQVALSQGQLEEAERLAGKALSAWDRLLAPVVILAAAARLRGDDPKVDVWQRTADRRLPREAFLSLVSQVACVCSRPLRAALRPSMPISTSTDVSDLKPSHGEKQADALPRRTPE
jgi:hypothetical protein